jgi:multiple sugar transport system permease protein
MPALSVERSRDGRRAIPFLLPTVLIMLAINLFPFINGMVRSLHSFRILTQEFTYTGLGNFRALLHDELFWQAFQNSLIWVAACLAAEFGLSMTLALVLNSRELLARRLVRTFVLIPWAMPPVVVALMWRYMLADHGPLNMLLRLLGIAHPPSWLLDPQVALWSCILVTVWMNIPFMTVMLLAGLQSVEASLYEAAAMDGAGFFQSTFRITLPAIKKVALVVLTLMGIWTFNMFDIVFVLTNGGPGNASLTLPLFAYQNAFFYYQLGYAAAVGIVMMGCLLFFIFPYIRQVLE